MERIWAAWRLAYVQGETNAYDDYDCIMCALADGVEDDTLVVHRSENAFVVLNAFPYTSGHLMLVPNRHVANYEDLTDVEAMEITHLTQQSIRALKSGYQPDGINTGMNLGRVAGAGIPGHVHAHVLPRWDADTNFMTSVAETRVLPEDLQASRDRIRDAWPKDGR